MIRGDVVSFLLWGCVADEQQGEPKSHLELMAEKRDYKRRRQSYRAKNVHITKKSYTEVGPPSPLPDPPDILNGLPQWKHDRCLGPVLNCFSEHRWGHRVESLVS